MRKEWLEGKNFIDFKNTEVMEIVDHQYLKLCGRHYYIPAIYDILMSKEPETAGLRRIWQAKINDAFDGNPEGDSTKSCLIFVANLDSYNREEKLEISRSIRKEIKAELARNRYRMNRLKSKQYRHGSTRGE